MSEQRCACAHCSCTVDATTVTQGDKAYCCEACANGHKDNQHCCMNDCDCAAAVQPDEEKVDNALDETFPASDPISP
ncbi:MAG: metallothionein [Pseudomonas sp.]|jgi:hypothetical protein|uniref:metallothionein n=1 Tax=Pseudomonas entomophila TaxID=312306 RepID=UPI0015E34992|nr:metallothionein [Pseudomonas entomophila]MBA1193117.1 metallothionein [Pseudomonas entomophila]MDF2490329.1 metallothionein [Pseudomonas sp.]